MRHKASSVIGEIVPHEILTPPMPHERRWLLRDECALVLDRWLRRLARQEARCRRVLGRIASVFLARRAHHRLGFARLGDYSRERLGISGRELQSLAQVVAAIERLPETRAAFERGEVSWAQLRVLASAATKATEQEWLSLARTRTVRALDALWKQQREAAGAPPPLDDDDDESIEGEPRVRFRVACPRRVSSSWRRAIDLAQRMSGESLSAWQAAEAIAAEGLSAAERESGDSDERLLPSEPAKPVVEVDPSELRGGASALDWSAIDEAFPDDVEELGRDLADAGDAELDRRMRMVLRSMQKIDWQIGRLLRLFLDMRLHEMAGFESASKYVRERLGISARKGRALVRLERKSLRLPELASAYSEGEISWVRALTLLPVASDAHAAAWVDRAKSVTVRRLADEVDWAIETRDAVASFLTIAPPPAGAALVFPERQTCARQEREERPAIDSEVAFFGSASVIALLRDAMAAFSRPTEAPWRALEKLLDHVIDQWTSQPRHRDPVFARDGWRCAVPGCSSRRNLHDHHVRFRSRGGDNSRDNRIPVCVWHHLRGLHGGTVRASGKAPDEIRWWIGRADQGRSLLELAGERYRS